MNDYSAIRVYDYLTWVDENSLTRVFTNRVLKYDEYFDQYYFEFKESAIDNLNSKRLNLKKKFKIDFDLLLFYLGNEMGGVKRQI